MKKIKAVFIDYDWTIYDHNNHNIPKSTILALNKARENGVKIFINSARTYYSLWGQGIFDKVKFDGYGIINGGASFTNEKLLHVHYLDSKYVREIIRIAEENNLSYLISTLDCSYIKRHRNDDNVKEFYKVFTETYPKTLSKYDGKPLIAVQVFLREDKDYLFDSLKDKVKISRFFDTVVEFNESQFLKRESTDVIMKEFGFKNDEVICIGDDTNDIDMFNHVKYSVCMGNGNELAKKHAYYITDRIENDGIYKALKHFEII